MRSGEIDRLILGDVTSELAFPASVEGIREGFQDYDFGVGPVARAGLAWYRDGARVVDLSWDAHDVATLNGSISCSFSSAGRRRSTW